MSSEIDLKVINSQELEYLFTVNPDINELVNLNEGMGLLVNESPKFPVQYNTVPSTDDYAGDFNFDIFMHPDGAKNWMYSSVLNKVFILNNSNFAVGFKWDPVEHTSFFVRAMPLFSSPQDAHKPVLRCFHHQRAIDPSNIDLTEAQIMHILRGVHSSAQYEGGPHRHLSVVLPLGQPEPGGDIVRHTYYFVCKNSCTEGMDRRPIEVVFTLEDQLGKVYGRRKVAVRVCSCPKRDKKKEEDETVSAPAGVTGPRPRKRKMAQNMKASSTTTSLNGDDAEIYSINIKIIGKNNYKSVVKYARVLMADAMVQSDNEEPFKQCYTELNNILKNQV